MSPGSSVMTCERKAISRGSGKSQSEVLPSCMTSPFSRVFSAHLAGLGHLVGRDDAGADRREAVEILADA